MNLTEKQLIARSKICLPLDGLTDFSEFSERVRELSGYVGFFKIGMGSYTRFGPKAIQFVHEQGSEVFLDLKYKDIPNTVYDAASAATELGVFMFNVHASGGTKMMKAAVEGANHAAEKYSCRVPKIIGVTVLTSFDEGSYLETLAMQPTDPSEVIQKQVSHLAELSKRSGLDGIVCSAADLFGMREKLPVDFMYVTPGIRGPSTSAGDDQKRIDTPGNAIANGSTILVIGRAITDPRTKEEKEKGVKVTYGLMQNAAYEIICDIESRL